MVRQLKEPNFPLHFTIGDIICHQKNPDVKYVITGLPIDYRIEKTNEPAYAYIDRKGVIWIRPQTEMEDGRFQLNLKGD